MPSTIFVLNGPNLNALGKREPGIYGGQTLADIEAMCVEHGNVLGLNVVCRQSNHEGDLIDWFHEAGSVAQGIAINAGAYTHIRRSRCTMRQRRSASRSSKYISPMFTPARNSGTNRCWPPPQKA